MKRTFEKFLTGILFASSTVSTLTVLLIVFFLFREGIGLIGKSPIEEGYTICAHPGLKIKELNAQQFRQIVDQEVTNWSAFGLNNDSIILFRTDDIFNYYSEEELAGAEENMQIIGDKTDELIARTPGMIACVSTKLMPKNPKSKIIPIESISTTSFFSGKEWNPTAQPAAQFGIMPLILGTLWVSFLAILIALPLGLAMAIYMAEIAPKPIRNILKPMVELLSGIPSVVYGFFGLIVIVPMVQKAFNLPVGETGFAGSIVLAIMALPTIITLAEDAIKSTPRAMKEASLALGATKWQTIYKVCVPYASSGITAAAILGIGRAIGETMAVLMVTGNAAVIPHTILEPMRTIPATIAAELGEAANGSLHYKALFLLGCILFVITLIINLSVEFISNRKHK